MTGRQRYWLRRFIWSIRKVPRRERVFLREDDEGLEAFFSMKTGERWLAPPQQEHLAGRIFGWEVD